MSGHNFSNNAHTLASNAAAYTKNENRYTFALEKTNSVAVPGMKVNMNDSGSIWGAIYDTGAEVRHNKDYSMIKSATHQLWLGDQRGAYHPLD